MPNTTPNLIAGGNIYPFRFVMLNTAANFSALQATANAKIFGVAQPGTNFPPISDPAVTVSGYAATTGQSLQLYGEGDDCLVEAGDVIAPGDYLKADAVGRAVPVATTGTTLQRYGAQALQAAAAAGEKIRVQVQLGSERPALA